MSTFSTPGVNSARSQGVTDNAGQSWHSKMSLEAFHVELKADLGVASLPPKPPLLEPSGKMALTASKWTPPIIFFEFLAQNSIPLLMLHLRPFKHDHSKICVHAEMKEAPKRPRARKGLVVFHLIAHIRTRVMRSGISNLVTNCQEIAILTQAPSAGLPEVQ